MAPPSPPPSISTWAKLRRNLHTRPFPLSLFAAAPFFDIHRRCCALCMLRRELVVQGSCFDACCDVASQMVWLDPSCKTTASMTGEEDWSQGIGHFPAKSIEMMLFSGLPWAALSGVSVCAAGGADDDGLSSFSSSFFFFIEISFLLYFK